MYISCEKKKIVYNKTKLLIKFNSVPTISLNQVNLHWKKKKKKKQTIIYF